MNGSDSYLKAGEIKCPEAALQEIGRPLSVTDIKDKGQDKNQDPKAKLDKVFPEHVGHDKFLLLLFLHEKSHFFNENKNKNNQCKIINNNADLL